MKALNIPASVADHAVYYIGIGWGLCSIPPGTKNPTDNDWNTPSLVIDSAEKAIANCAARPYNGLGLVHSASGTCAIDVDHADYFAMCMAEFGIDVEALFASAPRIRSREGRDKAIFRIPDGESLTVKKIVWPASSPGGKPVTVFELRAGAVQDVLPPSIHPDTQKPYTWAPGTSPWELGELPELPAQILSMWKAWDSFKPQFAAVCPWAKPSSPPPPLRKYSIGPGNDVIGKFNAAHDLATLLAAKGYRQIGNRWLSPTSESRLPGVVLLDEGRKCYSHHASDPLNDGHSHDAFSVFCLLDHGNDMAQAIKAAADLLGLDFERPQAISREAMQGLVASAKAKKQAAPKPSNEIPPALLSIPGVLGEVVEWANRTAPSPQPLFAVTGALAVGCTLAGRKYRGMPMKNLSALYFLNVGVSGCGKEYGRTIINRVLSESGQEGLIGRGGYASDSAVMASLLHQPVHVAVIDEFGALLGNAKSEGAMHQRSAINALVEAWGATSGSLRPKAVSTSGLTKELAKELLSRVVHYPALSLVCMSTPGTFYGAMSDASIESGFLGRFIVCETAIGLQPLRRPTDEPVPPRVVEWAKAVRARSAGGNLGGMEAGPEVIPPIIDIHATPEADALFCAFHEDIRLQRVSLQEFGLSELLSRRHEQALRLAVPVALSIDPLAPVITREVAEWCCAFVRHHSDRTLMAVQEHMHSSPFGKWQAEVLRVISKAGEKGRTERELAARSRVFDGLEPRIRKVILEALRCKGAVELVRSEAPSGRGRPREAWVAMPND